MDNALSSEKLRQDVHTALQDWHRPNVERSPIDYLLIYREQHQSGKRVRQATNEVLLWALDTLAIEYESHTTLLRKRFLDNRIMHAVANSLNVAESTAYRMQKEALSYLTTVIYDEEKTLRKEHCTRLKQRLEAPSYTELIGVESHLQTLFDLVVSPDLPWLIFITGMGGLGKTSVADALSRRMIQANLFDDFAWVSARQQIFNLGGGIKPVHQPALTTEDLVDKLAAQLMPELTKQAPLSLQDSLIALRTKLKEGRHLIVVDNLETIADIEILLPTLRDLSQPSKIILTSRQSLHYESGLYHYNLPGLLEDDTLRLIRHEARLHNLPHLETAKDEDLKKIFELVGGNPLAIRLVVGQTHVHPLDMVLADLEQAQGHKIESLYTFIYRRAWDGLDEITRRVFLAMPLVPEKGGDVAYLTHLTELEEPVVRDTLSHLAILNLVDSYGNLTERRYTIHNLTRTFLQEQVAKWML